MTVKAVNQATIVDVTDAYNVILTNDSHTFVGSTSTLGTAQSTTTQVVAMLGGSVVAASVTLSEVTVPTGVTVSKDTDVTSPTITFSLAATVAAGGTITIPVHVGSDITINKTFSFSIAFKGATGTTGATGATGKGISSTTVTYQASSSGTTAPTGTWTATVPAVSPSQYLWTKTVITYSDSTTSTAYSVGMMGATGAAGTNGTNGTNGADALTLVVTSSNGLIFKNSSIATVLTAHVYKGGVEVTGSSLATLGTIKWYKDGSTTAASTGQTLTIDAGDVTGKATYVAQLEG